MFAYQYEATRACPSYSSLSPGTPGIARYDRGHYGLVGVRAGDQTLAARSSQLARGLGFSGLRNEAHLGRWTDILPFEPVERARKGLLGP